MFIDPLSPFGNSSINQYVLARDIRASIGSKKDTSTANILRLGNPTVHDIALPALQQMRELRSQRQTSEPKPTFRIGQQLTAAVISVLTYPGETELTRIPYP